MAISWKICQATVEGGRVQGNLSHIVCGQVQVLLDGGKFLTALATV